METIHSSLVHFHHNYNVTATQHATSARETQRKNSECFPTVSLFVGFTFRMALFFFERLMHFTLKLSGICLIMKSRISLKKSSAIWQISKYCKSTRKRNKRKLKARREKKFSLLNLSSGKTFRVSV